MHDLTEKQLEIYDHLKKEIRNTGYPPSVREICKSMNLKSTSTVHLHLTALERKGFIRRSPLKNRSIEILEKGFYTKPDDYVRVPILGKVTAGPPILAIENIEDYFSIPVEYVNDEEVFMLRVQGDSMKDASILDRDLVLVRKQPTAENGDIVVALIEDSATVKTFYKQEDCFKLQPENPAYEPIFVDELSILGKVIGLFRKY